MYRKALSVLIALSLLGAAPVPAADSAQASVDEDTQNPVMNYIGIYVCGRAAATVEADGLEGAKVSITWGASASENAEWTMSGSFNTETNEISYSDGVKSENTYAEGGALVSQKVVYEDGTGTFSFQEGGQMVWKDDKEDAGKDMVFVFNNAVAAENAASGAEEAAVEAEPERFAVYENYFSDWIQDADSLNALIDYVEAVTDESSPDFIPVEDRIATFDMDGTLYGELYPHYLEYDMFVWRVLKDPDFVPDEEMLEVAEEILLHGIDHQYGDHMDVRHGTQAARAYAGMTMEEFAGYTADYLDHEADGFENMTYGEGFYRPMLQVIEYLKENDFNVYICTGSDRYLCRVLFDGVAGMDSDHIIGMDVGVKATNQGEAGGLEYVYSADDGLVRSDEMLIKNLKMNKVAAISKEIGKQPVLAFGNSSGDCSMLNYCIFNNQYRSASFMLIADDEERDYGNTEKAEALGEEWANDGYIVVSMRDDFRTIYGDDVIKTGSFAWADDIAKYEAGESLRETGEETVSDADEYVDADSEVEEVVDIAYDEAAASVAEELPAAA